QSKCPVLHVECDAAVLGEIELPAGDDGPVRSELEPAPELDRLRMLPAKFMFEVFDLGVGVGAAVVESAPGAEAAAKAEREVVGFSELASGVIIRSDRALERARCHHAVRFELRIAGLVVFSVSFELPLLTGQPR